MDAIHMVQNVYSPSQLLSPSLSLKLSLQLSLKDLHDNPFAL